jgi:hypothetical protein
LNAGTSQFDPERTLGRSILWRINPFVAVAPL